MGSLWNSWRITHRFMAVLAAFMLSIVAVAGTGLWGLSSARDSLKTLHEEALERSLLAGVSIEQTLNNRMEVLLAFQHDPSNELASIHNHPVDEHLNAIAANQSRANEVHKKMEARITDPHEKALMADVLAARAAWRPELAKATDAIRRGDYSAKTMEAFLAAGRNQGIKVTATTAALRDYQAKVGDLAYQQAEEHYQRALWVFAVAAVLMVVPSIILALALLGRLSEGFRTASGALKQIASSDLSQHVVHNGTDEIGCMLQHLETMRSSLSATVGQVKAGTGAIASASAQVAAGSLDLSSRTEQQASALQETASATEQLSSTVQHNADNAVQANQLAGQARSVAQEGGHIVDQMVKTMSEIDQSAKKIVDIISVIDGIAFQTNILALNAAVEAARAGEQGRGFAVVAGEVRSLAGRSAAAAREVQALITEAVSKAEHGNVQAAQAGTAMQDIVGGIQRVADIVDEIALASREQASGLAQINQAVSHLDGVTQQNAALVEESSAASSSLQQQARSLAALADTFRLEGQPHAQSMGGGGHNAGNAGLLNY